jgi:hypothetical protein
MSNDDGDREKRKITPLMHRQDHCQRVVREIARDAGNVAFSLHAFEREDLRGISTGDALDILRTGFVEPGIRPGKNKGEWICKVTKRLDPQKPDIGVVTVVLAAKRLLVLNA